jgi:hypothetical protein
MALRIGPLVSLIAVILWPRRGCSTILCALLDHHWLARALPGGQFVLQANGTLSADGIAGVNECKNRKSNGILARRISLIRFSSRYKICAVIFKSSK